LDAATNELASLIGRLDLQATPATPDISPLRADSLSSLLKSVASTNAQSAQGSPTKASKKQIDSPLKRPAQLLRGMSASSITSLHTYEETRKAKASAGPSAIGKGSMLGQEIAPRQLLNQSISPGRPRVPSQVKPMVRPGHERSLTPAEVDVPVLQPLRPPTHRAIAARPTLQATTPSKSSPLMMPHGSATFGRGAARKVAAKLSFGAESIDSDINASPTPVFHHRPGHARKRSSLVPASPPSTVRITRDIKPLQPSVLDLFGGGVVRGSVANGREMPINSRNPASDIPDDLHDIIAARAGLLEEDSGEESLSDVPPSPGAPPVLPLPIPTRAPMLPPLGLSLEVPMLCLIDEEQRLSDIEALSPITSDEDNTRKSFEFTAELNRLNESGASNRRSFVEQLANAFDTPAKIDILKFGEFLAVDAPPVPKLPQTFEQQLSITDEVSGPDSILDSTTATSVSDLVSGDSLISSTTASEEELDSGSSLEVARAPQSARSEGELNRHFRFGGRPSPSDVPSSVANTSAQLTLSDILPSPEHVRRLSMGGVDDSAVESIFAAAQASPASQRERVDSESMSQRRERNLALNALNGGKVADASFRPMSQASFAGFDSFDDVRRNFEFGRDRPAFYPAPAAAGSRHKVQDSMFSVASVSSYGSAWDAGSRDPFGYTAPSRPQSTSDMSFSFSMSGTVDDTFRFLKHDPMPTRNRVDSDASTFSFHAPAQDAPMPIYTRPTHRRDQSTASISSMAPPVSMHNRSFGHRRNASSGSASSFAMSYALHGAAGGRAAWARHRPQISIDSVISEVSALHVARPGLSDKMFDSAPMHNYGAPLSAISGSPANSEAGDMSEYQSEFASSYPYNFAIDAESQAVAEDSLFEKTDYKTGTVEDSLFEKTQFKTGTVEDSLFEKTGYKSPTFDNSSVFGGVEDDTSYMPSVRPFRPVSILSTGSVHHAPQDDDTMISVNFPLSAGCMRIY
jgi:serine/arginine repetitive matrix protein 2